MNKQTDRDLLRMYLLEDSQEAFQKLIERHSLQIRKIINNRVDDPNEQCELFQDLIVHIAKKLRTSYEERGTLGAWLSRVVVNQVNSYYRLKAKTFIVTYQEMLLGHSPCVTREDQEESYMKQLHSIALLHEFSLLNEGTKILFCKVFKEGCSLRGVAREMDIPFTTLVKRFNKQIRILSGKVQSYIDSQEVNTNFRRLPVEPEPTCVWTRRFFGLYVEED